MLCLLALIGDAHKAGYDTVRGWASVDPLTGENSFVRDDNGMHQYVIKQRDDRYYADEINRLIRTDGNEPI